VRRVGEPLWADSAYRSDDVTIQQILFKDEKKTINLNMAL
jgi:hypothetical protein